MRRGAGQAGVWSDGFADFDFLVEFEQGSALPPFKQFFGFTEALEQLLDRRVDLVERKAVEASRNYIRRRAILREADKVYGLIARAGRGAAP